MCIGVEFSSWLMIGLVSETRKMVSRITGKAIFKISETSTAISKGFATWDPENL